MSSLVKVFLGTLLAAFVVAQALAQTVPIKFDPTGSGGAGVTVSYFDWAPNSALAQSGNPVGGLVVGSPVKILTQAVLGGVYDTSNPVQLIALPANKQFTFVAGFGETVATCSGSPCTATSFMFDPSKPNFFEIWVKDTTTTAAADNLNGTEFNAKTRILYGSITDSSGIFGLKSTCTFGSATGLLDQYLSDDWLGQQTLCGVGGTDISVQVISVDDAYFPGFTPDLIATVKLFFNTSTILPFKQVDPSKRFITEDAGASGTELQAPAAPNLGSVNGAPPASGLPLDVEFQADANNSFTLGTTVPGACRVTYGGNDRNGNIDLSKFGSACAADKGNKENCYTFGGQVGAPTANAPGPFGEHTHHQVSGPAGDFVFRAGTRSAPKESRITAMACKDPGACRQAEANAGFKQIDFEGTGTFRTLNSVASTYLKGKGGGVVLPDNQSPRLYYFRVDMDDFGEPGNKQAPGPIVKQIAKNFLAADVNAPLGTPDPLLASYGTCNQLADVYQFYICPSEQPCEVGQAMYAVSGYLTGGNIQLHKVIK